MNIIKKRPILSILFIALIALVGFFSKDTYKKQTEEIRELKIVNTRLNSEIKTLTIENFKIKVDLSEQKNLEITEKKNADGSSIKTTKKTSTKNLSSATESVKRQIKEEKSEKTNQILSEKTMKKENIEIKKSSKKLRIGLGVDTNMNYVIDGSYNLIGPFGFWGNISKEQQSIGLYIEF